MKKIIVLCLCGLLVLTGCGKVEPKLVDGKQIVAEIDGKQITAEDLYSALKEDGGTNKIVNLIDEFITAKEFTDNDAAKAYAEQQYKSLKAQYEAQSQDLDTSIKQYYGTVAAFKEVLINDYKTQKVAEKYLKENLTDDEINKYYTDEIFGTMTVRHILIIPDTTDSMTDAEKAAAKTTALNKAKDLITQLNNGANFETLAKGNSEDTGTAKNGGLFENFDKSTTDAAFWQASYNLKDGEYTKTPIESAYGYHIILKVSSKAKPTLDESKDKIKDALVDEKIAEDNAVNLTWAKIRDKYKLNITDTTIKSEYDSKINSLK